MSFELHLHHDKSVAHVLVQREGIVWSDGHRNPIHKWRPHIDPSTTLIGWRQACRERDLLVLVRHVDVKVIIADGAGVARRVARADGELEGGAQEIGLVISGNGDIERGNGDVLEGDLGFAWT